ncbi:unnamed protein product, partial [Mesorhabditis spiculigera]
MLPEPPIFKETHIDGFGDVEFLDGPTEKLWKQWYDQIAAEGWSSDDVSMRTTTPILPSTRCVFARRKDTGDFLGTVTWNEYDGYTFIGIFLVLAEMRGKASKALEPRLVSQLTPEEFEKLLEFDRFVTGRDRSQFLRLHYGLEVTEGAVLFGDDRKVVAVASVGPTDRPEDHNWKVAPIYANNLETAATLAIIVANWAGAQDEKARILLPILDDTRGAEELATVLKKHIVPHVVGITLYNGDYSNPIRLEHLYVPHNNSGHFDA